MNKKEIFYLISACIILIAFRLFYIGIMPHADEYIWLESAVHQEYFDYMAPHPPLSVWIYNLFYLFTYYIRLVPIIFNVITFIFGYLILKEFTDGKPLKWYFMLSLFSFYNYLAAVQIDIDGAILTALMTASIFFFIRYDKTKSRLSYALSALIFGLAMLAKMNGLFILMIIGLYLLIKTRSLWQPIKIMTIYTLIGGAIFSIFPIFYHSMPRFDWIFIHGNGLNWYPTPLPFLYLLIWGTPLLVAFLILSYKVINKENMLLAIWAFLPLCVYLFGKPFAAPFDRYLMIIIPPALVMGTLLLDKYLNLRYAAVIISSVLFSSLAIFPNQGYPIHSSILNYISQFDGSNFLLPMTGPSGPLFGLPIILLFSVSISSIIVFILAVIKKDDIFFVISLSLLLGLNLILILSMVTNFNQPRLNDIKIDMFKDVMQSPGGLSNEKSFIFYNPKLLNTKDYQEWHDDIFIFDFPLRYQSLDIRLAGCSLIKEYSSRNQTFGYWYGCP